MDHSHGNGHEHPHTAEEIIIRYDPQAGKLEYRINGLDYMTAIMRLTMVQFLMFEDLKRATSKADPAPMAEGGEHGSL